MANEINFDFAGAEAAGLSRQDIVREIEKSGKVKFDFTGARKAGISDDEIYTELSSRGPQQIDEEDIVAGPPEDDMPEGDIYVGEVTAEAITTLPKAISEDNTASQPSTIMYGKDGKATTVMQQELQEAQATVPEQAQEAITKAGGTGSYIDPTTGKKVAISEGGITPDYPMLVGTRLGLFGGPGMMGEAALKTLATSEIPRGVELAKDTFDNLVARGGLFKEFAETKGTLSKEAAYIIARHPNMTEDEMVQALTGVKTADQAYALSRMLGEPGYIKQAVRAEGDAAAGLLRADLESGKNKIVQAIGEVDVARAKAQYGDMVDTIAQDYTSVHNATPILEDLNFLERFYGVTPSAGNRVVTQMKATLGQNPNINLSDALEFRADLNYLINKATRGKEKVKLNAIKDNLDGFINSVASPGQKQIIDDAVSNYSRTMQNRDVLDLIQKNTDDRGIAVNWTKLHRELNDANLRSPEAVDALRIAEAFSKRFGNDQQLLQTALPRGSSPDSGGVLGAWGYLINHLKDTLALYGNRAENLKIQKAIMKSLKKGTTNLDFVNAMKADKDIPEDVIKVFEPLQIPYKPEARQTGDVNLEPIITPVGGTEAKIAPKASDEVARTTPVHGQEVSDAYAESIRQTPREELESLASGLRQLRQTPNNTEQLSLVEAEIARRGPVARTADLPEDARITNGDDGYYYIELPPYNGTNVLGQSGRTPSEVRRLAEDTFGRFNIPLASNAEIKAARNVVEPTSIAETLTGSTRRRHLDRLSENWDDLNLNDFEDYPFSKSFDELDLSNADVYNQTEAWLNGHNTSIREMLEVQAQNVTRETRFEGLSSAELLAKRNEMLNTPKRNRNNAWQQEWEEVNTAYARAPATSNEMPSTKPPEVDTNVENPYSRAEDERSIEGDRNLVTRLREAIQSGNKVLPDLSEDELKAVINSFPESLQAEYSRANMALRKALKDDESDLTPFHQNLEDILYRGVNTSQSTIPNPLAQAEETFNTLRRDIQRLERVRVADRTPQQSKQLTEMRRERLMASREVERLRNEVPSSTRFFNSFKASDHTIEVSDRGNGSFTLGFNSNRVPVTVRNNNTVSINTQDFTEGGSQGAKFYKEFYKALDAAGLKHNISGLTNINTMRLPINIYKHKLDTGNLPIAGGQAKLQSLMSSAIRKINEVAGTDIRHLTDSQITSLATRTGPMRGVHAGEASLKLYRKAARLLGENRNLSVIALAPLINAAYEEQENE